MTPSFSPEAEAKIDAILARYPDDQPMAALIPVLYLAQSEFGYLTVDVMSLVASRLDLPETQVLNTATFYSMLRKKPVGKHHVQVCTNVSCWLRGADEILAHIQKKLGVGLGETTADRKFTLDEVQCLGSCGTAPVVQIDDTYYENLSVDDVTTLLDELAGGRTPSS